MQANWDTIATYMYTRENFGEGTIGDHDHEFGKS